MATITGTLKNAAGVAQVDRKISFDIVQPVVQAIGSDTIVPDVVTVTSGVAGALSFSLPEGEYTGTITTTSNRTVAFPFWVPAGATADFNDCLTEPEA